LRASEVALEIDSIEEETTFLSKRVRFMEESIPELEKEVRWLVAANERAEKDRALIEQLLLEKSQSLPDAGSEPS
jgi:hypothetical protein